MRVLINGSNIHSGGGLQVAVSFLYEVSMMQRNDVALVDVVVSSEVYNQLCRLNFDACVFSNFYVLDTFGVKAFFSKLNSRVKNYDLVFTIFGPNYLRVKAKREVVGFAQLWILEFDNPITERISFFRRGMLRLQFYIKWLFFLRADHFVVELEHVKNSLIDVRGVSAKEISVVYNTVSSLYFDKSLWKPILFDKDSCEICIGIVARDYPHKNIDILPSVAQVLKLDHGVNVHFYTTLNDAEWSGKSSYFKEYVSTVGSLSPDQCPFFYEQMDGVIFPSLLECFSATPLEAMVMEKPLFASDRGFVRDVCGDFAVYFDPLDPNDIARKIANYFTLKEDRSAMLKKAREHATNFSSAKGRAGKYLEIIQQNLKGI